MARLPDSMSTSLTGAARRRALTAFLGVALGTVSWVLVAQRPAAAVTCPASPNFDFLTEHWDPSDHIIAGFRAPIVLRTRGSVCSPDGHVDNWVAVESLDGNGGISQIGWRHDAATGYCRFWEYNTDHGYDSGPRFYDCGLNSDGDEIWFKVEQWYNSSTDLYYWGMWDCGGSWTSCTAKGGGPRTGYLGAVLGAVDAESNYGGSACTNLMMGSSGYRVRFGEGQSPDEIRGQRTFLGSYSVRSLTYYDQADCPDYASNEHTDSTFRTYDTRN